ncbi:MAG: dihydroorotate dehydrogenase [Roseomonas sp.]|nr:dihydroorotate dehydrogenase [Roseomonas sp.]
MTPGATGTDMRVRVGGLDLANPVMPASGTFAEGLDRVVDLSRLGAIVTKTITRELREGNALPRVAEVRGGMLNAIGIPSKGVAHFLGTTLPLYRAWGVPLVVSISAPTAEGFASLAAEIGVAGVAAIEANISCPNIEEDGRAFAMRAGSTEAVVRRLRAATHLPLWVKLSPNTGEIAEVAQAAEAAGADALVVANTMLAMSIDLATFRPSLGNVMGGLSGPALKPIVLRQVYQCARAVRVAVIGCGGIASAADAAEYMLAGAAAVQVGTATFLDPHAMTGVIDGLDSFCAAHRIARVAELTGALRPAGGSHPATPAPRPADAPQPPAPESPTPESLTPESLTPESLTPEFPAPEFPAMKPPALEPNPA